MIKFDFADFSTQALDMVEALELILPEFANENGIISTFCQVDDSVLYGVRAIIPFIVDGGNESLSSICNAILSGEWTIVG